MNLPRFQKSDRRAHRPDWNFESPVGGTASLEAGIRVAPVDKVFHNPEISRGTRAV